MCGQGGEPVSQMMPRENLSFIVLLYFFFRFVWEIDGGRGDRFFFAYVPRIFW